MDLRPIIETARATADDAVSQELVDVIGARVHRDIVIPRTNIRAKLRLASRKEVAFARAEARRTLIAAGFPVDASAVTSLGAGDEWQFELALHILAVAVRNPADVSLALAPIEDWRECDEQQIEALGKMYEDLEAELDPLGEGKVAIGEELMREIVSAAKKKQRTVLISFGSSKLANCLLTLVEQLSTSPTPKS